MSPGNNVDWTLETKRYKVLGSEACLPGQGLYYDGDNWVCDADYTKTTDRLGQLIPFCAGRNNLPTYNGTNWVCSYDFDYLTALNCTPGQVVKSTGPHTWACANDNNTLATLAACGAGTIPVFRSGAWQCGSKVSVGSDTLISLVANCTNGYIPKYINGVWRCAVDNDFLGGFSCPLSTPVLIRTSNNTWGCGSDNDTFRDLTNACAALGPGFDTPILNASGWTCITVPTFNQSSTLGTVLYTDTFFFFASGLQQTYDVYFFPIVTPYSGVVKAFSIRPVILDGPAAVVSAAVTVNGNIVQSSYLNNTFLPNEFYPYGNTNLFFPVSAGSSVSVSLNSTGAMVIITTDIYLQLNSA